MFEKGLDAAGRKFAPYTEAYRKWKLKQRGGVFSGPEVNLQLRGRMRAGNRPKLIRPRSGVVGPTGASREWAVHVDALRPWIELSTAEVDAIPEVAARICERLNREHGGRRSGPGAGGSIV